MSILSITLSIRLLSSSLLITSVIFPSIYQQFLDSVWLHLQHNHFYQWSTFETIWTVFWYAVIEGSLTEVFMRYPEWRLIPRTKPRGMRRPSRRLGEILVYIAPLLAMDFTMIKKFAGVPLNQMLVSGNYNPAVFLQNHEHNSITSTQGGAIPFRHHPRATFLIPTLHNFTNQSPLQLVRALPSAAPSARRLVLELVLSFLIYDAVFFFFHLALHLIPPLFRWHAPHHAHDAQLNPQVTNQLSVVERLGLVMLANFSLNIIGAHVLTRTLFVPIFVWLLVEIHCGMDLPWGYEKVLPGGLGGGAAKHMRHHRTGKGGFEPFFCWLDWMWDTVSSSGKSDVSPRPQKKEE